VRRLHEEMPLPGKVERPQRVTRLRRIKAESNAAGPRLRSSFDSAQDDKRGERALRCAVLKLDTEGVGAAQPRNFSKLSACEERRRFFCFAERG
jgi:hypothetical protein